MRFEDIRYGYYMVIVVVKKLLHRFYEICSFLLLWFLVKLALTDKAFKLHQDETHCLTLSTPPFRSAAGKEELCDGLNLVATHCRCL